MPKILLFTSFISSFLTIFSYHFSIQYPVSPTIPSTPTPSITKFDKTINSNANNSITTQTSAQKVKIILENKNVIQGKIQFPNEISFYHYRNQIRYLKKVKANELLFLKILSYKVKSKEKRKKQFFYEYIPNMVQITLKDNKVFMLNSLFTFLEKIKINTEYGETTLFTIFADTYHSQKGWKEVQSKDKSYHNTIGHPLCVKEIHWIM